MLRRKRLPESLLGPYVAFRELVGPLERAKAAVTEAVPTARLPGRPLAEALAEFEELLSRVRDGMEAWRSPAVEAEWVAARAGLEEALAVAESLRLEAPDPEGFEGLVGAIGDLIAPLEAFEGAAGRFRALRS